MKQPSNNKQPSIYDVKLLFSALLLVGIGVVMVYSASSAIALKAYGNDYYFLKKQVVFSLSGIFVLMVCSRIPYKVLEKFSYPLLGIAIILLVGVYIPGIGYEAGGAKRWLRVNSISFQPSEFAKFAVINYLAYSISKKKDQIKDIAIGFFPHVIVFGIFAALIISQPDFGTVVILAAITWIMMFAGGVRITHLFLSLVVVLPLAFFIMTKSEYRLKRLTSFLDPWQYPANEGYQIVHSLMAFGTGGVWGSGLGQGYQKLFYLPEPHTDFILSVIGEELGLFGVYIVLTLFSIILWQGITIAKKTNDRFGALLALGITVSIGCQVFVNMGVALGLLPTKGLTLPFLSYGGSSLLMNMAFIGILMNIGASRYR